MFQNLRCFIFSYVLKRQKTKGEKQMAAASRKVVDSFFFAFFFPPCHPEQIISAQRRLQEKKGSTGRAIFDLLFFLFPKAKTLPYNFFLNFKLKFDQSYPCSFNPGLPSTVPTPKLFLSFFFCAYPITKNCLLTGNCLQVVCLEIWCHIGMYIIILIQSQRKSFGFGTNFSSSKPTLLLKKRLSWHSFFI